VDNDTLKLLARFTIQARKIIGSIDTNLLAKDALYSASIFQRVEELADEELVLLSLTLRQKLGLLEVNNAKSSPDTEPEPPEGKSKYKFGARG
jgi:hypothetical protein